MKFPLAFAAVLTAGLLAIAADAPPKVTYVGHDKVAAAISKGGPLVTQPDLTVTGSHRDKAGQVDVSFNCIGIPQVGIQGAPLVALVGTAVSPGIFAILVLIGRERAVSRLDRLVRFLSGGA